MHIFEKVRKDYEDTIFNSFKKIKNPILYSITRNKPLKNIIETAKENPKNQKFFQNKCLSDPQLDKKNFKEIFYGHQITTTSLFNIGLSPFSILSESGARVSFRNFKEANFIKDPELSYERRTSKGGITALSITEKVDQMFNKMCQIVAGLLGKKTYLKLYLRRTLCGGEFGICLNTNFIESEFDDNTCLIDKDSIVLVSLKIKSVIPILSGILIIFIVYVASIVKKIIQVATDLSKLPTETVKQGFIILGQMIGSEALDTVFDKISDFLRGLLMKTIGGLNSMAGNILSFLLTIFESDTFDSVTGNLAENVTQRASHLIRDMFNNLKNNIGKKFLQSLKKSCMEPLNSNIMKLSALILLNLAAFIVKLVPTANEIKHMESDAKDFDDNPTEENANKLTESEENLKKYSC